MLVETVNKPTNTNFSNFQSPPNFAHGVLNGMANQGILSPVIINPMFLSVEPVQAV